MFRSSPDIIAKDKSYKNICLDVQSKKYLTLAV